MRIGAFPWIYVVLLAFGLQAETARAQDAGDRADPTLFTGERQPSEREAPRPPVPVTVDAPSAPAGEFGAPIFVGAVTIAGLEALSPADFSDLIVANIGRTLPPAELAKLANAIAGRMRARGYAFASAWIEPQRVANGVLTVSVDEGRIDELRFVSPAPAAVRQALRPLVDGKPAQLRQVERRLLLASDLAGVRIQGARFVRDRGRGVLLVSVRHDRVQVQAQISNQGTKPIGPEQLRIEASLNGFIDSHDALTLTYAMTPAQPSELRFGQARYARRISDSGTELALVGSASVTHPGAYLEPLEIRNRSWYAGVSAAQPLLRRRKGSAWLEGELGLRNLSQWRRGTRVRRDQITTARLTLYGYGDVAGGRLRGGTTVTQGLGILDATGPGDPLASRRDADGTFTSLVIWGDWTAELGSKFSLRLGARGQIASDPLLISEEATLGGTAFLRGYDWGERTGDQGVMGSAELRYLIDRPLGLVKRAQIYGFVDGGSVSNLDDGPEANFGGGSLASAGGGVRLDITANMGATLEVAAPLTGDRYDTGDEAPRFSFGLVRSFR